MFGANLRKNAIDIARFSDFVGGGGAKVKSISAFLYFLNNTMRYTGFIINGYLYD